MFPEGQLAFFSRCRNLTTLVWSRPNGGIPTSNLAHCLERELWPHLEDLNVYGIAASDEVMATVIRHLPPLKRLSLGSGSFGPLSLQHLRERLFGSLKTLALSGCDNFTSPMVLEVLSNCQQLEEFMAPIVSIKDLRTIPQPWVCRGLRCLEVVFINDEDDSDDTGNDEPDAAGGDSSGGVSKSFSWVVFEHLSTLHRLEVLNISPTNIWFRTDPRTNKLKGPQFRLDVGLGQLATLTRLKELSLDNTKQDLRREDVEWMLEQWLMLEKLTGALSTNSDIDEVLGALVERRRDGRREY
ncbi:hypothetical protein BGW39_011468 [Mortierella sp. 14UC]|nr:hypothetical protein BGW39_011468 [Mortierella sp. 14UC]